MVCEDEKMKDRRITISPKGKNGFSPVRPTLSPGSVPTEKN